MKTDGRGLAVTCDSDEAIRAADDFTARLLRLDNGVEAITAAADSHEEVVLLQLYAAAFFLFGQTRETNVKAAEYLGCAERWIDRANPRERSIYAALRHWHADEYLHAMEVFESVTGEWPEDLLSAKMAEFLYYVLGQQHCGGRFRAHLERIEAANGRDPDYLGMRAFAHELCGDFEGAMRHGERAIEIEARNPWAQHAVSHVLIRQGRVDEGLQRMEEFLPLLEQCGRLIHCHDAWHLALLHLERLDFERTEAVLDRHVWGITPQLVSEQLDAIALLWRIEMAGKPMDGRWQEVADHVEPYADGCFMPFMSAHQAYALARAGRDAALDRLIEAVFARAEADDGEARRVWAPVGRAVVEASAAYGKGDRRTAAEILGPVMPSMTMVGGSDAQDDLFRQMYLTGLTASGRKAEARVYFDRITGGKQLSELDRHLSGQI